MEIAKQIGRNCAEARMQAGLTQHALAHRLFIHPAEISRLECGRHCPRLTTLLRLARVLEVPLTDLLEGVG
jgi:transcriptional regulator with XRE-family HTH domain